MSRDDPTMSPKVAKVKAQADSGAVARLPYARIMDTALALVRHGQTDWNLAGRLQGRTDIELNETGREQARAAGRALMGDGWDLVLASPLSRAQETAALIAAELGVDTGAPVAQAVERGFGPLEGRVMIEVTEREAAALAGQAESRELVLQRMLLALTELVQANPGRRMLVVSHGAAMRITRDALAGTRAERGVENGEVIPVNLDRLAELVQEHDLAGAR
ncbi:histidine phosphatase family protein [Arthrobacter sp. MYb211]|nr:histidine phosphatase family protein [Arthrobacter sp. MYb229]PRA11966.1 histidine phosphatase family protein [Arthrobacter sp. MYb221]PRB49614.1 histidine phosphatase family protein [Arthrobacter sp. MYb216]PRC08321.1 histidine phosphatase family protein [Arthrobacter sp. MYb211]